MDAAYGYDALGRVVSDATVHGARTMQHDLSGNMTRLTWTDGFYVTYDHLVTGEVSTIKENGSVTLATFGYDAQGRRSSLTYGNGAVTSYSYDALSRLGSLTQDITGTTHDITLGFAYNPASQIITNTRSNDLYAWGGHGTGSTATSVDGLNQLANVGGAAITYNGMGNIASDGTDSFIYTYENELAIINNAAYVVGYDVSGRLDNIISNTTHIRFNSLGDGMISEEREGYTATPILRRYVYGPGVDEPLVWHEGAGTSDKRFLHADERGSIIAVTNGAGAVLGINSYDEYGKPAATNIGRFQYTGQLRASEFAGLANLYYYKTRWLDPRHGKFMQGDRIGFAGGMNWYNYTGGDPVNNIDPSGMKAPEPPKPPADSRRSNHRGCGTQVL